MKLTHFLRLFLRHKIQVFTYPVLAAVLIYAFALTLPYTYSSQAILYTGINTGVNIESDKGRVDNYVSNSKFDNLLNIITLEETQKETALRIMANYINHPVEFQSMIKNTHNGLLKKIYASGYFKKLAMESDSLTLNRLYDSIYTGKRTQIYELIYGPKLNPFSLKIFSDMKSERIQFSDMIRISFTANDPKLCKKTVDYLIDVVFDTYKNIKVGQIGSLVKYYRSETALSKERLEKAEEELRKFKADNKIVNYYEQTRSMAIKQDNLSVTETDLFMKEAGYKASIAKIESKLNEHILKEIASDDIVKTRNQLATLFAQNSAEQSPGATTKIKDSMIEVLRNRLNKSLGALYNLNNTTEGLDSKTLLDNWIINTVNLEQVKSELVALKQQEQMFGNVFFDFAPLGSDLSKLEREQDVEEKEYLSILLNLSQAELKEKNLKTSESFTVLSPPDLPILPDKSKRMAMVIAGFAAVLIFVIVRLILLDYFDERISNPARLTKLTGLETATGFVDANSGKKVFYDAINTKSNKTWLLSFKNEEIMSDKRINNILLLPFNETIAIDPIAANLAAILTSSGLSCEIRQAEKAEEFAPESKTIIYTAQDRQLELLNIKFIKGINKIYLVFDAHAVLNDYQLDEINRWKRYDASISTILVNVYVHDLEPFLGKLPVKKNRLTLFITKLIRWKRP